MPGRRNLILLLQGLVAWPLLIAGVFAFEAQSAIPLESPTNAGNRWEGDVPSPWRPFSYSTDPCPSDFETQVVVLINQERAAVGLPPLRIDTRLQNAARRHSEDMAVHDFFSHTGSDGTKSWDRATQEGYIWTSFGENIAAGQTTPEQVVAAWMASTSGHKELILDNTKEHIGVGFVYLDDGNPVDWDHYWTADIGATDEDRLAPPLVCDPSALQVYLPLIVAP